MKQVKLYGWLLFLASLFCTVQSNAQISTRKLEAIYLYNFTKYINFPTSTGKYTIGVLQEQGVANELQSNLQSKGGVEVRSIGSVGEAQECHILYVPKAASSQLNDLVSHLNNSGVLIVTEEDLAAEGAPVSFVVDGSKLRFKINKLALEQTGLQASSNLLSLAILV